jgi:hypothetical protein
LVVFGLEFRDDAGMIALGAAGRAVESPFLVAGADGSVWHEADELCRCNEDVFVVTTFGAGKAEGFTDGSHGATSAEIEALSAMRLRDLRHLSAT